MTLKNMQRHNPGLRPDNGNGYSRVGSGIFLLDYRHGRHPRCRYVKAFGSLTQCQVQRRGSFFRAHRHEYFCTYSGGLRPFLPTLSRSGAGKSA